MSFKCGLSNEKHRYRSKKVLLVELYSAAIKHVHGQKIRFIKKFLTSSYCLFDSKTC